MVNIINNNNNNNNSNKCNMSINPTNNIIINKKELTQLEIIEYNHLIMYKMVKVNNNNNKVKDLLIVKY